MKRIFFFIYVLQITALLIIPFVGTIVDEMFKSESAKVDRALAKGTFYLIEQQMKGLDEPGMKEKLAQLQPNFGYPLRLYHQDEIHIDSEDRPGFLRGDIILGEGSETMFRRMTESSFVLSMGGPFPGFDLASQVFVIFILLYIICLILPSLGMAVFISRDIRKIERMAERFASGDHSARVTVSKVSSMIQIATAFNHMAEKSQKLLASQKEMTNSVSHEMRTPLARIKFSLEMLIDAVRTRSPGENYLVEIGRDVEEIESLVDEMLTYARFGRERESSEDLRRHEMISWLDSVIRAEKKSLPRQQIIFVNPVGRKTFIAPCEPVYLAWAVRNLIRNASRYSKARVQVSLQAESDFFSIHVDDDGTGVPEAMRDKIFEPFFRIDKSRNKDSGGYGLGLAIAKRIAIWHRGEINISGSPLGGARFSICLPSGMQLEEG